MTHALPQATLSFRGVTVHRDPGDTPVLRDLSFAVAPNARVALLGLNGSGKTTLFAAAAGLLPHEGEIHIDGQRLTRRSCQALRRRMGFVFNVPEDQLLFPTAVDDVAFGARRLGQSDAQSRDRASALLHELGMRDAQNVPLHHLSHGQKQRVALAGALIGDPALLLLDEPSAGLDPPGKRLLCAQLTQCDAAMLIATHDLDFAARICTRFLMLDGGRIAHDTALADDIRQRWQW